MQTFNFYVNIDQCLNKSDFDMFFYQQESEKRFYMAEASFEDDGKGRSLESALHEIHSVLNADPFIIRDFRLIFGMRQTRSLNPRWTETVLYRQLRIYYGLRDANIFIRSRETMEKNDDFLTTEKNVSILMLYDTDLYAGMPSLPKPDTVEDIRVLLLEAGANPDKDPEQELYGRLYAIAKEGKIGETPADSVTVRFLRDFFARRGEDLEEDELEADTVSGINTAAEEAGGDPGLNVKLAHLVNYLANMLDHYCVFQKEIDANDLAKNMLALLSVVEYITLDISEKDKREVSTLRQASIDNWKKASDDDSIYERYGLMLYHYQRALHNAQHYIAAKEEEDDGKNPPAYSGPDTLVITGESETLAVGDKNFGQDLLAVLDAFDRQTGRVREAENAWTAAYRELENKMTGLTEKLVDYANLLSEEYRKSLYARRQKAKNADDTACSREKTQKDIDKYTREEQKHKEKLRRQNLNSSLRFQEELNLQNALKEWDGKIRFYTRCLRQITMGTCIAALAGAGGLFLLHYLALQGYVLADAARIGWFGLYLLAVAALYFVFSFAPLAFFRWKIHGAVRELKQSIAEYLDGYTEKVRNFNAYINELNALDSVHGHLHRLKKILKHSDILSGQILWHKTEVEHHLDKVSHFNNMIESLDGRLTFTSRADEDGKIEFDRDVKDNALYWPQKHASKRNKREEPES